jgi:hypothetical protein
MEVDESLGSSDLETSLELPGFDYSSVRRLKKDFSNFPEWAAAVNRYGKDNDLGDILNWTPESPRRDSGKHRHLPAPSNVTDNMRKLWHNNMMMDHYASCYMQGATDARVEALGLCAEQDSDPVEFVRKFKSAMVKLNRFKRRCLNEEQQVLQFIAATKSAYPQYAYEYVRLVDSENMSLDLVCERYLKFTIAMAKLDCFKNLDLSTEQRGRLFSLAVDSVNHKERMTSGTSG